MVVLYERLNTFQGLVDLRGISQHSLMIEAPKHHKQYIAPQAPQLQRLFTLAKSKLMYRNSISRPQCDTHQPNQDNRFTKAYQGVEIKLQSPFLRKGHSKIPSSSGSSPRPVNFPFPRFMSNKEPGKRSVSPIGFRLGSVANRSVSSSPSHYKQRSPSVPRRVMSVRTNSEREIEPYNNNTKRSKHLFKALLDVRRSGK